ERHLSWGLLLRRRRAAGERGAAGHGLLPLPVLPVLVGRAGECLQHLGAGGGRGGEGGGACRDLRQDGDEPPAVLPALRRPPDGAAPAARRNRRLRRHPAGAALRAAAARELRRDGAADAGRPAEAPRLPEGVRRLRGDDGRI
ncbi:MAG: hypothetical protein AVDCRST_MAG27-4453, partial [uncultured Craurococcus sp.]